jgi:hypothetical protein
MYDGDINKGETDMTKTIKINRGLYEFTYKGRTFQVEDMFIASDGESRKRSDWNVYEMDHFGGREWCNDFVSKRDAIQRTILAVDAVDYV